MKLNVEETSIYLYNKIFNDEVFEIYPKLKECYLDNPTVMDNLFADFIEELYDLSKPVVKPFLNERYTYAYRKVYGILDNGEFKSMSSVGKELNISGSRIAQYINYDNRLIINMFINEYNSIMNSALSDDILIEELGLSIRVYNQLKRMGINYVSDIDFDKLDRLKGFGEKSFAEIEKSIVKIKK